MRTVAIIGAGASVAHASSFRPTRNKQYPPLDATFFDKVQMVRDDPVVASAHDDLLARLAASPRFDDPWLHGPPSLEQFFADVYYEVARERDPHDYSIYLALLRLYTAVLAATTNWMALRSGRVRALGQLLRRELSIAGEDPLTIVTFNQDLLIENEAMKLPRSAGKWCLGSLYGGVSIDPLYAHGPGDAFLQHKSTCPHSPPFTLLKLHGSLNWGITSSLPNPPLDRLFPRDPTRKVYVMNRRQLGDPNHQMYVTGKAKGRKRWYLHPLVIPPIYDKSRLTRMKVLSDVWTRAHEAVSTANRVLVFGYSLPPADMHARQALRRAFTENHDLSCVVCVDPDPAMVTRLAASLDCRSVRWYRDLPSYLNSNEAVLATP